MKRWVDLPLAERERAAIVEAASLLRSVLPVHEIQLFGSKCRGDDDAESDVDLLVLTQRPTTRAERHAACDALYPLQLARDVVISLLVVAAADWRSGLYSVLPIRREIEEDGVTVAA